MTSIANVLTLMLVGLATALPAADTAKRGPAKARDLVIAGSQPYKYLYPLELSDKTYVLAAANGEEFKTKVFWKGHGSYRALQIDIVGAQEPNAKYFAYVPLLAIGSSGEGTEQSISVGAGKPAADWQVNNATLTPKIDEANQHLYRTYPRLP